MKKILVVIFKYNNSKYNNLITTKANKERKK